MATIVERFAAVGIFNRSKDAEGNPQRTTGRGQTSLAAYFTSRFRVLPSGAVSYSIPLNSFTQVVDEETGEVLERTEHVQWVQVVFPHPISAGAGDHLLAIGRWQAGKQRGVNPDGTAQFWNDTIYISEWAITPKAEKPTATVTEVQEVAAVAADALVASVVDTRGSDGFPFGQSDKTRSRRRKAHVTDLNDIP